MQLSKNEHVLSHLTYAELAMVKGMPRSTGFEAGVFEYVVSGPFLA